MRKLTSTDILDHRDYERERDAFRAEVIKDIEIEAKTAGTIANTQGWKMEDMRIKTADGSTVVAK